ncbi:MAG: hypothetical protein JXQ76_04185 [Campylobacterales bacterium]|nr:hypothetical protein [Campylobacterales bacterium]
MRLYSILLFSTILSANEYQLGHGLELNPYLTMGGYFSSKYENSKSTKEYMIDDVAILAYGRLGERFSYLVELEAAEFWVRNFGNDTIQKNMTFRIERAYVNYKYNDYFSIKAGKFITPIGFWNLNPITVLKDTTSNPRYASEIYPKFTTGAMVYGYLPFDESIEYNAFIQKNKDLDKGYNNIQTDDYYGMELKKHWGDLTIGLNMGKYELDEENMKYFGASLKYETSHLQILSEYAHLIYNPLSNSSDEHDKYAYYIQGRYKLNAKHYLVGRYEKFEDEFAGVDESVKIIGYNYRPIYPISIKCEYQLRENDNNSLIVSFSMLF